ncbi:MAG: (2Fe-2S)-binding protein [Candidatus Heimdallarchaeota archaeon]|nr:MAG: (2Fe-2S)-binding protein [Candidatus Heimdallarchaeota archaeon]
MKINLTINNHPKTFIIDPSELLIDVLRREGYVSVKRGCDEGTCGACVVLLNGKAVKSCILLAAQAHEGTITTIEGVGTRDQPHPLQLAFVDEGAIQCGFCIPGILLSAKALLDKTLSPTKEEVKIALDGNLCRCTGYSGQIKAVLKAAAVMRGDKK